MAGPRNSRWIFAAVFVSSLAVAGLSASAQPQRPARGGAEDAAPMPERPVTRNFGAAPAMRVQMPGTLVRIDGQNLIIRPGPLTRPVGAVAPADTAAETTVATDAATQFFLDGQVAKLADLGAGMSVSMVTGANGTTVLAYSPGLDGEVVKMEGSTLTINVGGQERAVSTDAATVVLYPSGFAAGGLVRPGRTGTVLELAAGLGVRVVPETGVAKKVVMGRPGMAAGRVFMAGPRMPGLMMAATQPSNAASPIAGPAVPLDCTIYELRLPPADVSRIDLSALTAAATVADFERIMGNSGQYKSLYRVHQSLRLGGDRAMVGSTEPFVMSSRKDVAGETVNTIQYRDVGAIVQLSGRTVANGQWDVDLQIQLATMTDSSATIAPQAPASSFRQTVMSSKGPAAPGTPLVVMSGDATVLGASGKAVVYLARVLFGTPSAPAPAATQPAPLSGSGGERWK